MIIDLSGRVALVTGAAQGIGFQIARCLGAAGARVMLADISGSVAASAATLAGEGLDVASVVMDVTDESSVADGVAHTTATLGPVQVLVNNAGISRHAATLQTELDHWNQVLAVNLTGPFLCSRACLPAMEAAGWGRIVMISSFNAKSAPVNGDNASYAASKAGLTGLIHNLAVEFGPSGVTVNAIAPGIVDTELLRAAHPAERLATLVGRVPVGRFTTPAEIAATVVFLASDAAASTTGEIINVNGGLYFD